MSKTYRRTYGASYFVFRARKILSGVEEFRWIGGNTIPGSTVRYVLTRHWHRTVKLSSVANGKQLIESNPSLIVIQNRGWFIEIIRLTEVVSEELMHPLSPLEELAKCAEED